MCPVIAGVAMGLGQTALTIAGQQQAAKEQERAQAQQSASEQERYLAQQSAERINQRFQEEQVSNQIQKSRIKAMEARATARASAGESGVTGTSVDLLMSDLTRKQAVYRFGLLRQQEQADVATNLRMVDNLRQSNQNLLSINKPIEQPNYADAFFGGIKAGVGAYSSMKS